MGTETSDDAGVFRIDEHRALVQTVDFFPPLVDDPYQFGQIAAANALSDVYAMNGRPLTVLNLVAFPEAELDLAILGKILQGAAERVHAAGAVTVGGHSVRDSEIKFGLSVTGLVDPSELLTNAGARPGDQLVLTKPLGTGFVTTAAKKGRCPNESLVAAIASMVQLNELGRDALRVAGEAHSLTDITGYGLAGHGAEMAEAASLTLRFETSRLPRFPDVGALIRGKYHTRASQSNREFLGARCRVETGADPIGVELAFDAQTSGGLLIAVSPQRVDALLQELSRRGAAASARIGEVLPRQDSVAVILG